MGLPNGNCTNRIRAYPGFGELVVLDSTDRINSCKPLSRTDPPYTEILGFLWKLKAKYKRQQCKESVPSEIVFKNNPNTETRPRRCFFVLNVGPVSCRHTESH